MRLINRFLFFIDIFILMVGICRLMGDICYLGNNTLYHWMIDIFYLLMAASLILAFGLLAY
jgi:hypothetical protein